MEPPTAAKPVAWILGGMSDEEAAAVAKEILQLNRSCLVAQAREDVLQEVMREDVKDG